MVVRQTLPVALQQFAGSSTPVGSAGALGDVVDLASAIANRTGAEVEGPITASTVQTQAGAFGLTASFNHIATANGNDAIRLPQALPGSEVVIINSTGQNVNLFPAVNDAINAAGANNSVSIATATTSKYYCTTAGQWWGGATTNEA